MFEQRSNIYNWIEVPGFTQAIDQFPDGSFRLTLTQVGPRVGNYISKYFEVILKTTLPEAMMLAAQAVQIIKNEFDYDRIALKVQTMPDSRADRREKKGMAVPLQVTSMFLANMGADEIIIFDPHSEATMTHLIAETATHGVDICEVSSLECFEMALMNPPIHAPGVAVALPKPGPGDWVVQVDAGAKERAREFANHHKMAGVIVMEKQRVNGKITGNKIAGLDRGANVLEPATSFPARGNFNVWIVDDICDGGRTFNEAANTLYHNNMWGRVNSSPSAIKPILYVTHGLFSQGKTELEKNFSHIISLFDYSFKEEK